MSRDRKQKNLLYLVLMIVLIAGSFFQHFYSNAKVDNCLDAGHEYDFNNQVCVITNE